MAADVALHRLVPAQSRVDEPRSALPGVPRQRSAGRRLPAEAAGDAEVGPRVKQACFLEET